MFLSLKESQTSTLAKELKSESLNEDHLDVTTHASKNMIRGTYLEVSFSSHLKKRQCAI